MHLVLTEETHQSTWWYWNSLIRTLILTVTGSDTHRYWHRRWHSMLKDTAVDIDNQIDTLWYWPTPWLYFLLPVFSNLKNVYILKLFNSVHCARYVDIKNYFLEINVGDLLLSYNLSLHEVLLLCLPAPQLQNHSLSTVSVRTRTSTSLSPICWRRLLQPQLKGTPCGGEQVCNWHNCLCLK
jgi:hypothetical protein